MKQHRPFCLYEPWSEEDKAQYEEDLESGFSSRVASSSRGSRRKLELPAELLTTTHDRAMLRSMLLEGDVEEQESEAEVEVEPIHVPARPSKRKRVETPEAEPEATRHKSNAEVAEPSKARPAAVPKQQLEKRRKTKAEQQVIDTDTCFAGLVPRRKLKVQHDWFDPDSMAVSVPYPMRYYLSPKDGKVVVSSDPPEEAGVQSLKPEGTLYESGNRVGPEGMVDPPADRTARQPCEGCRFR
jgi:hypothetical protein